MNDPFDLLRVHADPESADEPGQSTDLVLHQPHAEAERDMTMLVSWSGHTDAGTLSEQLADALLGTLPHRQIASFDVDELFDYRSRRPRVTFSDNRFSDLQGPRLDLYEVRDAMDRPFLLLTGDEPDFQWERVSGTILELVERLDVKLVVLVDALGLPTPHTRPLGVTAHGNRQDLTEGISTWSPAAQIEAGLAQMLELRLDEAGRDVVGYTLHVPHYLAGGKYPQVAVAALEYTGAAMELMLPTDELREAARMVDMDISRQVSQSPEISGLIQRLESNYDEYAKPASRSLLVNQDEEIPDAEELGAAVEAFLRSQDEEAQLSPETPDRTSPENFPQDFFTAEDFGTEADDEGREDDDFSPDERTR
ncbi:PAC2 family protein [Nesterenkonia flava]|uniref:PAC2 family protein n=1 Tax=Nesterenkonia flava TaxID=469799 RepID=A0ABU1FSW2_9MICC|nr:PAC2 family protein [Nesterenkonia flava]MDR5711258.1 PAC2 family protein [Nesterenkonia flava]